MFRYLGTAFRMTLLLTVAVGLVYPLIMTGLCQGLFPAQANGSLIVGPRGEIVGSTLIAQDFTAPDYFHPRPSAAGNGYDPTQSGGSNLGATNLALIRRIRAAVDRFRGENPGFHGPVPADMVTASASGLDPDISPAAAEAQVARVAAARGVSERDVRGLVEANLERPQLGLIGDARVNVLKLNLALDRRFPRQLGSQP